MATTTVRKNKRSYFLKILLRNVWAALEVNKVHYWLNDGTLLGAVRDNDFLYWEHDIDLGMWSDSISAEKKEHIANILRCHGYRVLLFPAMYMTVTAGSIWLDIEFYERKDGMAVLPQWLPVNNAGKYLGYVRTILMAPGYYRAADGESAAKHLALNISNAVATVLPKKATIGIVEWLYRRAGHKEWKIPAHYFDSFDTIEFQERLFSIPANPEKYLAFRYGDDWRTPKPDWTAKNNGDGGIG